MVENKLFTSLIFFVRRVMRESKYQRELIKRLRVMFPGCVILKNDSSYLQGILDLSILYGDKWAMLEVKASATAPHQPNQDYYVEKFNGMSYAAFIYPENEEEVLSEIQQALRPGRRTRNTKP
jgi:hypothetical protein